ncbi:MAG: hypothetical protein ABI690_27480 [Chloroflexota bacterium]
MKQLTIEYLLEGHMRGYNFTSPTQGFHDDVLKSIWRKSMPRGQGWGADVYAGAHSLKSFWLEDGRMALSEAVVTDMRDESGRGGIRRAVVSIMQPGEYLDLLKTRFSQYPDVLRHQTDNRILPNPRGEKQLIFFHPYADIARWQAIEALILRQALRLSMNGLIRSGKIVPFTTLALDYHDEGQIVVLPEEKARTVKNENVVRL